MCAEEAYAHAVEAHGEVVRNLSTGRYDNTHGALELDDIHHTLEGELVEEQAVTHIIVGRYGLGVVVDHHAAVALLADGVERLHTTPVELY